jgi:hypothetical protein
LLAKVLSCKEAFLYKHLLFVLLIGLCGLGVAQETAPADEAGVDWVIWMDGTQYVPEWSNALEAVLQMMKPGQSGLLFAPGSQYRFVRQENANQHQILVDAIRPNFEQGANRFTQLCNELSGYASAISFDESAVNSIRSYLLGRKQLLDLYSDSQQRFWKSLDEGLVPPGARLLVLVQQLDVPAVNRDILSAMMEVQKLKEWSMDLQNASPWEQKTKIIKQHAERLKSQNSRVDAFYLKYKAKNVNRGTEVSKAFFSGVTRLCKASGGVSQDLKAEKSDIINALAK